MAGNAEYRKNDNTYLGKSGYDHPKEYFKLLIELIRGSYADNPLSILDVGCASGAFLNYALDQLTISESAGVDISDELVAQGQQQLPGVKFTVGSIEDLGAAVSDTFDVCTCLGTLGIFDEIDTHLQSLLDRVKPGGMLLIFDAFNEHPIDVLVRFRAASSASRELWQTALNTFSMATYEDLLDKHNNGGQHTWVDFNMPFPIEKSDNPMRAWPTKTENKDNQVIVGTGQYLDQKVLQIIKSK
jgi:SAM-dependent methyltransferase